MGRLYSLSLFILRAYLSTNMMHLYDFKTKCKLSEFVAVVFHQYSFSFHFMSMKHSKIADN